MLRISKQYHTSVLWPILGLGSGFIVSGFLFAHPTYDTASDSVGVLDSTGRLKHHISYVIGRSNRNTDCRLRLKRLYIYSGRAGTQLEVSLPSGDCRYISDDNGEVCFSHGADGDDVLKWLEFIGISFADDKPGADAVRRDFSHILSTLGKGGDMADACGALAYYHRRNMVIMNNDFSALLIPPTVGLAIGLLVGVLLPKKSALRASNKSCCRNEHFSDESTSHGG